MAGQHHGPYEDSRKEPWPGIKGREGMRSLLKKSGLGYPDPTLQSRSEVSANQGQGGYAGSPAETPCVSTHCKPSKSSKLG